MNTLAFIQQVYADKKWTRICFDLLKVNKKVLTCLKSVTSVI